jgi:hypothetical protein
MVQTRMDEVRRSSEPSGRKRVLAQTLAHIWRAPFQLLTEQRTQLFGNYSAPHIAGALYLQSRADRGAARFVRPAGMCLICPKCKHFVLHDAHSCGVLNRYKNFY